MASLTSVVLPVPTHSTYMPYLLKYNISPVEGGVILSIWEPAVKNEVRVKPFLYMIRYRLPSEAEAMKLLSEYLATYKTKAQIPQEI
ncbi:MAG: hypothetical protein KME15_01265 [Drouetiella hepatica Uher 2000/2452]|jgi:hypothetical protein|uniref:Uncharacterized protein n=1 Tax=Drouetiella hepatica Uher 2000/2452 TaxID=904376 RepID=A0A951UKU8_9CYAN|nr:hypothetical protein [Drouetiella hepatica Uher 2000/2452]